MSRWSKPFWTSRATPTCCALDRSPEAEGRLENLKELINALQEFDSLPAFLEHVALLTDNAERATAATW